MNKKKKKTKTPRLLIHPTQEELANMVAEARKQAEEAIRHVEIVKGNLQSIIDEANVTNPLIPYIQPQYNEGLINVWSSVADQVSKINKNLSRCSEFLLHLIGFGLSLSGKETKPYGSFQTDIPCFDIAA